MTKPNSSFNHGYVLAVANIVHLHGETTTAQDVLDQLGIDVVEIAGMGLTEYDLAALRRVFPPEQHHLLQERGA